MDLMNVPAKFEVHSFTRSSDNSQYLKKTLDSPWIRRSRSPQGDWFWYQSKARTWLPISP